MGNEGVTLASLMEKKKKGFGWFSQSSDTHGKSPSHPSVPFICDIHEYYLLEALHRVCLIGSLLKINMYYSLTILAWMEVCCEANNMSMCVMLMRML